MQFEAKRLHRQSLHASLRPNFLIYPFRSVVHFWFTETRLFLQSDIQVCQARSKNDISTGGSKAVLSQKRER